MQAVLLTDVAEIANNVAVNLHMICVIDPINEFLNQFTHHYFLRLSVCLRTLVGLNVRTMLVGITNIIKYLQFMVADNAARLYSNSELFYLGFSQEACVL